MVDTGSGENRLGTTWRSLGARVAVALGGLTALAALVSGVPAHVASLRGGAAWLAILTVVRIAGALQARLFAEETEQDSPAEGA